MIAEIQDRLAKLPDGAECRITIKQQGPPSVIVSYFVKRQEYGLEATSGDVLADVDAAIRVLLSDVAARTRERAGL